MKKHTMLKMAILAGLLSFSSMGWAWCTASEGAYGYSETLPVTTLYIPRDRAVSPGPVGEVMSIGNGLSRPFACSSTAMLLLKFGAALTPSPYSSVYKTNIEGIGIRIWDDYSGIVVVDNNIKLWYGHSYGATGRGYLTRIKAQYWIIGPVTAGQTVTPNVTVQAWVNTAVSTSGGAMYNWVNLTGSTVIAMLACETPDITVDLKKQDGFALRTIGATTPETPFDFRMNNCDPAMSSVSYTFRPGPGITLAGSGAQQHLTLSNSSTASGVGVQVLYRDGPNDGQPVPFNTKTRFTGYDRATGGDYSIPMKARYIRTGRIVGGTANSSVEFTMAYE